MKATCKLCGQLLETEPDPIMDASRDSRERTRFFQLIARHIDPRMRLCTASDQKLVGARFAHLTQDNGWFQRWRLLACVQQIDSKMLEKAEQWRDYLHTITTSTVDPEAPESQPESPPPVN